MINWSEADKFKKRIPSHLSEKLMFGHIAPSIFDDEGWQWLEEHHQELKQQPIVVEYKKIGDTYEPIEKPIGFYGELWDKKHEDIGIAMVSFDNGLLEWVLPQHFMTANELLQFIYKKLEEEKPEVLI